MVKAFVLSSWLVRVSRYPSSILGGAIFFSSFFKSLMLYFSDKMMLINIIVVVLRLFCIDLVVAFAVYFKEHFDTPWCYFYLIKHFLLRKTNRASNILQGNVTFTA